MPSPELAHDYFPLAKGAVREYAVVNASGKGTFKIEVLTLSTDGPKTVAECRRVTILNGGPAQVTLHTIIRDSSEIRVDGVTEFKLPVKTGLEWILSPRRYWIEALDALMSTPAGTFKKCLRVAYLIAEGDGGSGERYYAPGVGLVKVVENDEAEPFTHELIAYSGLAP